ncbi:MAG: tetratricopeptide repeat protein [Clostridiales bacterium]|nr:tetratricopeptide repeat protein [Clostridiales bacterium]
MNDALRPEDFIEPNCPLCPSPYYSDEPRTSIDVGRMLEKLDSYLDKNDTVSARRHLEYWLAEAEHCGDFRGKLTVLNEIMGLHRKAGRREEAVSSAEKALALVESAGLENTVSAATTYLNAATVYKAFGAAEKAIPLYLSAQKIYESELEEDDPRRGGLYNNMALAYVDLGNFSEADKLYHRALSVMSRAKYGELEQAVTLLNMANAAENEHGLLAAEETISGLVSRAEELLDSPGLPRNGYYAFVCEKCAPTFGYYGYFLFQKELERRAKEIYERA